MEKKKDIKITYKTDFIEQSMGSLLRFGVICAAVLISIGAVHFLFQHGFQNPDYSTFRGEPAEFTAISGILKALMSLRSRGTIMFGLLILILTPIARIIFALILFSLQKDRTYILVTSIVLTVVLLSFFGLI